MTQKLEEAKRLYKTANADQKYVLEKLFPELKESEDERIRKALIHLVNSNKELSFGIDNYDGIKWSDILAWLEKQGGHPKKVSIWKHWKDGIAGGAADEQIFLIKIGRVYSISSCLGCECDYIELSELDKLLSEKQGEQKPYGQREECFDCQFNYVGECKGSCAMKRSEQKPADKVEPKFNVGDWIVQKGLGIYKIVEVCESWYEVISYNDGIQYSIGFDKENDCHLWTIQDAKEGDVLVNWNNTAFIFKTIEDESVKFHIAYNEKWDAIKTPSTKSSHMGLPEPQFEFHPATKEQRDTLMKAMADAGYTFDFEKKQLKKIVDEEQIKNNLQDNSFRRMFEQNPAWSEEEEVKINRIVACLENLNVADNDILLKDVGWLKSLRPQSQWKPSDEQMRALEYYMHTLTCNEYKEILFGLYTDLKKLKGE